MRPGTWFLLAVAALLGEAAHAAGEPTCRPSLAVWEAKLSEDRQAQRTWTARILVDAARCADASGRFTINFVRLKDNAPDLHFVVPFTWASAEIKVSTDFAADEAVLHYSITAAPCTCR